MTPVLSSLPSLSVAGWTDAAAAVILIVALVVGSVRGLSDELSRLLAFAVTLAVVALAYAPIHEAFFPGDGEEGRILAFAGAFLLAAIAGASVYWGSHRFLRMIVGQPADGIAGAALAAGTALIALLIFFSFARLLPLPAVQEAFFEKSVAGRIALPLVDRLVDQAFRKTAEEGEMAEPEPAPVAEATAAEATAASPEE